MNLSKMLNVVPVTNHGNDMMMDFSNIVRTIAILRLSSMFEGIFNSYYGINRKSVLKFLKEKDETVGLSRFFDRVSRIPIEKRDVVHARKLFPEN